MKENLHKFLTEGGKFHGEVSLLFIVSLFHIFPFSNQNQIQRFMCYDHTFCYWLPPFWIQDLNRTYTRRLENIQHVMHFKLTSCLQNAGKYERWKVWIWICLHVGKHALTVYIMILSGLYLKAYWQDLHSLFL